MCDLFRLFRVMPMIFAVYTTSAEQVLSNDTVVNKEKLPVVITDYSTRLHIGEHLFFTELADTPEKMQTGMMYRNTMQENQAMLFIYPRPQAMTFWMKNTLIPLDMLFFNSSGVLQEIKSNIPPCQSADCPIYPAKRKDNQFVIELKGGQATALGIKVGDRLQ